MKPFALTLVILLLIVYPSKSQEHYYDLGFEELEYTDTTYSLWKTGGRGYRFLIDTTESYSGNNSFLIEGTFYKGDDGYWQLTIPKNYLDDVHAVLVHGYVMSDREACNTGFWVKALEGRHSLGYACTIKDYQGMPGSMDVDHIGINMPSIPYVWHDYTLMLEFLSVPTSIVVGGVVLYGKGWFDNFEIWINGRRFTDIRLPIDVLGSD